MKQLQLVVIFFTIFVTSSQHIVSQKGTDFCAQITALNAVLKENHYNAKPIDDAFSKAVYELFINALDPEKIIFTKDDIEIFNKDKEHLDSYITQNNCSFIDKYSTLIKTKIKHRMVFLSALKNKKLRYNSLDSISYNATKEFEYSKNSETLDTYWDKKIRLKIIYKVTEMDSTLTYLQKNFIDFEKRIKEAVIENEICLLEELLNHDIISRTKEQFLKAIAHYQDPNSVFFNFYEKEVFETALSTHDLSFGIAANKNEKGDIVITYIEPGGAAFLDQKMETNDVILNLTSGKTSLNTNCVSIENITEYLNQHDTIVFKVKNKSGGILDVKLTKSASKIEENSVRGYVLNNDYGYIKIPSFYIDFESSNNQGLANDVAKEVYKLKKENIKGLILDLRYNGGGSMSQASDLVGMFINKGPITIIKQNSTDPITVKDFKRGSIFSKPIVIIVNSFSASASELFAGAMQDYNRAIIVGSTTYGKATAQLILPIHADMEFGFSKITVEKFYRISGKSHQSTGVVPDVIFPSFYDDFEIGEQYESHTLKSDSIAVSLQHTPLEFKNKEAILKNSKNRILTDKGFQFLKKMNAYYLKNFIHLNYSLRLNLKNIYEHSHQLFEGWEALETSFNELKKTDALSVTNSESTNQIIQFNDEDTEYNKLVLVEISTDFHIKEALNILTDYSNLN